MEGVEEVAEHFRSRGFRVLRIEKVPGLFWEVGIFSAQFNRPDFLKVLPLWLKAGAKLDAILARNIWLREVCNIALRPAASLESRLTPVSKTTAVMIAATYN